MTEDRPSPAARALSGRTAWARSLQTPLRVFLRTETGSAAVLVAMTVAALVWINISASSYEAVWGARLSVRLAGAGVSLDLREWVNSGLMTFFFFVFGLEARREFDMGELRQRRRLALPVLAGLGGLIVPVGIYLVFNHGPAARGWGAAMLTDTAFALGMLALVRPGFPDRVRASGMGRAERRLRAHAGKIDRARSVTTGCPRLAARSSRVGARSRGGRSLHPAASFA